MIDCPSKGKYKDLTGALGIAPRDEGQIRPAAAILTTGCFKIHEDVMVDREETMQRRGPWPVRSAVVPQSEILKKERP
jgi:hypothetical protein